MHLATVVICFLTLYVLTMPVEGVDTVRYAADAVKHASGIPGQFWEFGHLLWRPWGFLGFSVLGNTFKHYFHDNNLQAASRFLIVTNFFASLGAVILLWDWLRRLTSISVATLVAVAFSGANGFLQEIGMGSAYIPAIFFQILSLWLLARATYDGRAWRICSAFAGLSFGICTLLWFPFVISGLGLVLSPLLWLPDASDWRTKCRLLFRFITPFLLVMIAATIGVIFAAATRNNIHNVHALLTWITESNNGWSQSMNLVRAATGFPRTFFELSSDSVSLKRWFLHDPYHPVRFLELLGGPLLKLAIFYAGMLALLILLKQTRSQHRVFLVMGAAIVPLVFFALVVFEATATVRYLPAFPFLFAGIAIALQQRPRRSVASFVLVLLLVTALLSNFALLALILPQKTAEIRAQKAQLESSLIQPATLFALTLHEPFYLVPISRPLDHGLWSSRYEVTDLIEPASKRVLHWKGEFAKGTLASWSEGKDVWVTGSVFSPQPPPASTWIEGDDRRITWSEIHTFFVQITTDKKSGGTDGFFRVAKTDANRELLTRLAQQDRPDLDLTLTR